MVILPEDGTETTIPSGCTFENSSTIHTVNLLDLSFHLMPIWRLIIENWFLNKSRTHIVKTQGLVCWIACENCLVRFPFSEQIMFLFYGLRTLHTHSVKSDRMGYIENRGCKNPTVLICFLAPNRPLAYGTIGSAFVNIHSWCSPRHVQCYTFHMCRCWYGVVLESFFVT